MHAVYYDYENNAWELFNDLVYCDNIMILKVERMSCRVMSMHVFILDYHNLQF